MQVIATDEKRHRKENLKYKIRRNRADFTRTLYSSP